VNWGALLKLRISFGVGRPTFRISAGLPPAPKSAPVAINDVMNEGADITDALVEQESDHISEAWRM
jgi:hypothetical protein